MKPVPMNDDALEIWYGTTGEDFAYGDVSGVLQALADEDRLTEGAVYYSARFVRLAARDIVFAEHIIESLNDAAADVAGDRWEYVAPPKTAINELQSLIETWAAEYMPLGAFYRSVGGVKEIRVTAEDVESVT